MTGLVDRDVEQPIADAIHGVFCLSRDFGKGTIAAEKAATALRAKGYLPGPDTIPVKRELVGKILQRLEASGYFVLATKLRAALPEPPAPKEQQP